MGKMCFNILAMFARLPSLRLTDSATHPRGMKIASLGHPALRSIAKLPVYAYVMLNGSGERGIACVACGVSSVECRCVRFIQRNSELQPSW